MMMFSQTGYVNFLYIIQECSRIVVYISSKDEVASQSTADLTTYNSGSPKIVNGRKRC